MAAELGQELECERCGLRAIVAIRGEVTPATVCPACGKRARMAGVESLGRVVAYGIAGIALIGIGPGFSLLWLAMGFGGGALVGGALETAAWARGRNVRVTKQLRAPRQLGLPEAYARKLPPDDE